jgi:hypothetical protein
MVMDLIHKLEYVIEFIDPVDYFDVVLQKQIDLRLRYEGNTKKIVIVDFDNRFDGTVNSRLVSSCFIKKYTRYFNDCSHFRGSLLELNNSADKYNDVKYIYNKLTNERGYNRNYLPVYIYNDDGDIISYEEFEYNVDLMLEEFKLFVDKFEFNSDEKRITDAFVLDEKIKSNIKFIGWRDYWITV